MLALLAVACMLGCAHIVAIGDVVNALQSTGEDILVGGADADRPFVARLGSNGQVVWRWADTRRSGIEALAVSGDDVFALAMDCVLTRLDARTGRRREAASIGAGLCRALATDGTDLVVEGAFEGRISVGAETFTSRGLHDVFIAKVSPHLALRWVRQVGGAGNDLARGLARVNEGYVLVGSFSGEVSPAAGGIELAGTRLVSQGDFDALVVRIDDSGRAIWARGLGGPGFDVAKAARVDAQGHVYVVGSVQGIVPRAGEPAITQGHLEALLAKLSATGEVLWQHVEPSVLSWHSLDVDGERIVAVGHFDHTARIDRCVVRSEGATDVLVARFDTAGHCLGARAMGGPEADFGYAVTWRPHGLASAGRRDRGFVQLAR